MNEEEIKTKRAEEDREIINAKRPAHAEKIQTANKESLKDYAKFYSYLCTISGGAIVLSVSFLGSIEKFDRQNVFLCLDNINLLQLSWIAFGTTIALALMFNKKNIDTLYWDTVEQHADFEEKDKINEIGLMQLGRIHVMGGTIEEQTETTKHNQKFWNKQKELAAGKKNRAQKWNQRSVQFIHVSFFVGVLLLILFAITTLGL